MDAVLAPHRIQPYLLTGERILWSGRPKQGFALSAKDALLIPFSLLWGGFAIFWNVTVWFSPFESAAGGPDWFFRLWGLPFLIVGLYFIAGRFFHDARLRRATLYAVTDRRILILRTSRLTSLDIDRLPRLELSEHRDGTGTLNYDATSFMNGMNGLNLWVPALGGAQFFRIRDPRNVYKLIRDYT